MRRSAHPGLKSTRRRALVNDAAGRGPPPIEGRVPLPRARVTLGLFIKADVENGTIALAFEATEDLTKPDGQRTRTVPAAMFKPGRIIGKGVSCTTTRIRAWPAGHRRRSGRRDRRASGDSRAGDHPAAGSRKKGTRHAAAAGPGPTSLVLWTFSWAGVCNRSRSIPANGTRAVVLRSLACRLLQV